MSDVWYCIDESDTGDWVTSIWDGLGIPASQIPSTGESGAAYLFNDIAGQGASPTDEFSSTILTVPPVGVFTHDEYSALSFTGAGDGVYTATYMAERNGAPYLNPGTVGGEWVISLVVASEDNKETEGTLVTKINTNAPNSFEVVNNQVSMFSLTTLVLLTGLSSVQETIIVPENKQTTATLVTDIVLIGSSNYIENLVVSDNRQSTGSVNTKVLINALSTQTVVLNIATSSSLNTPVRLTALSQIQEAVIAAENVSTSANVITKVYFNTQSTYLEQMDSGWENPVTLFNEPREIKEISLSFDQLGRPVVFYRTDTDDLYLYWFNAITQQNEIRFVSKGKNPVAGFDIIDDTSDATSDVMLFYVRNDTVFMRIQREDYNIEYNTGVTLPGIVLKSSGMRVDNRFQVVYGYPGQPEIEVTPENPGGIQPPDPEPPIDPTDPGLPNNQTPIDGRYVYKNAGYSSGNCMVANSVKINCRDTFSLGYTIDLIGPGQLYGSPNEVDPYNRWHHMFGLDSIAGNSNHIMCIMKHHKLDQRVMFTLWIGANGYTFSLEIFNMPSVLGDWKFEFSNGNKVKVYFNGELKDEDFSTNPGYVLDRTRLTFGGYRYIQENTATGSLPGNGSSFDGALSNCWVDHPNYGRIDWPITIADGKTQQSIPAGHPLEFTNYRDKNWVLIKE